ncbi:MAG TPA: glycosyltransferase family 4 protein [Solirubrobacterales bacterium]|nr:glycosyltransferase family 4 protein [Solirubrobacterales bacterium]
MATRVLVLLQNEPVPSDRHVWNQVTATTRAGYEVTVICPSGDDRDRAAVEHRDGVAIHRYRPLSSDGGAAGFALEYAAALWSIGRLVRRLGRERRFDLVHACSPPDFLLLTALGQRRRGARLVFDHHDLTPELYRTRFGGGALHRVTLAAEQIGFRCADVVLSVNDSYRRVAIERGGCAPEDVAVVRTGPDLTRFVPSAPDPELRRGRRHLLAYAGVMGPQDGVDEALRSLAALRRERDDWHAVFMGDGAVLEEMRTLTAELGLADRVEFTGWVEHETIAQVLSSADVCLAPDPSNPLNDLSSMIKISEYMAMSRPIVSFDLAESRFGAGEAAVFAAPGDHAGFARLVSELLDDPERRAAMGTAGRARVGELLAWEHQERSLLNAYQRALAPGLSREGRLQILSRLLRGRRRPDRRSNVGSLTESPS